MKIVNIRSTVFNCNLDPVYDQNPPGSSSSVHLVKFEPVTWLKPAHCSVDVIIVL